MTRRLGKRAIFGHAVIQSPEKMLERTGSSPPNAGREDAWQISEELGPAEVQEKLREMVAQHRKA